MVISVIGLGLIGGSYCKTLKKHTKHTVFGYDINQDVLGKALSEGVIDGVLQTTDDLSKADVTIVSLYPETTLEYIASNAANFKKGSIVTDVCGIKTAIVSELTPILAEQGVEFIGGHPMAGREFSGFDYSIDTLFDNASLILTPTDKTNPAKLQTLTGLGYEMNFKSVVVSTPEEHDEIIAYTSQLAHVVSNAYIKSPAHLKRSGFSAGSFEDLTRVAKLNEEMWTSLFALNKTALVNEIDILLDNLTKYKSALENGDNATLKELLRQGRILKETT